MMNRFYTEANASTSSPDVSFGCFHDNGGKKGETAVVKQHQSGEKPQFVIKTCRVFKTKRVSESKRQSDGLTGRFLAESKKTISSADDSPSLALARSALILINACD